MNGIATSISTIGWNKYLSNDKITTVINTNRDLIEMIPSNDKKINLEENIFISQDESQNIIYNTPTIIVENYCKPDYKFNVKEKICSSTCCTTAITPNIYLNQAICQVVDINDKNNYILQYLTLAPNRIYTKTIPVIQSLNNITFKDKNIHISLCNVKPIQKYVQREKSINVTNKEYDKTILLPKQVFVENQVRSILNRFINITPPTVIVDDYKPPVMEENNTIIGINSFRIVAQKYSFFEYYMSFTEGNVIDILGLPQGMILENSCLKGSPLIAGDFPISILLDNKTTISGLLTVTQIPRHL